MELRSAGLQPWLLDDTLISLNDEARKEATWGEAQDSGLLYKYDTRPINSTSQEASFNLPLTEVRPALAGMLYVGRRSGIADSGV